MCQFVWIFSSKTGTFPLFVGLGLIALVFCIYFQLKRFQVSNALENKIMECIPFSLLFGVLTGYFSDVLFRGGIKALLHPVGYGITFYGWLIGCIIFYSVYAHIFQIRKMFLFNLFLPAFSIAQGFGRIGCFLGGCCFGKPASWGVVFPSNSLPYLKYQDTPLIPVQLFESIYLFLIFLILFSFVRFKRRAAWYLILMSCGRFFFEFLRGDNRGTLGPYFSPAQYISIVLFITGIISLFVKKLQQGGFYVRPNRNN